MTGTQKVLLELLKELDEICRSHGIVYYLVGGSALGAVRHHGFIPWDDDADIVMDHENYLRFIEVMKNVLLPPQRAYEDPFIEPYTTINVFGRYSATDTTCIFTGFAYQDTKHGIKVDVFQLLPCPDEGKERQRYLKRFRSWAELCHPTARNREASSLAYKVFSRVGSVVGLGKMRLFLFSRLHVERYGHCSQYLYCYEKVHVFYDRAMFGVPHYFPFEDVQLPVPTKYQDHFRAIFGDDWYCIPETEERITHLNCEDTSRSFSEYTRDYMRYRPDGDAILRKKYKYAVLRFWEKQSKVDECQSRVRVQLLKRKYDLFWKRERLHILALFERRQYVEVLNRLSDYLADQDNDLMMRTSGFIESNVQLFNTVCASLLLTSRNKKARRLFDRAPDSYGDDITVALKGLLLQKDSILQKLEAKDKDAEILLLIDAALLEFPDDRDLLLWRAQLLRRQLSLSSSNQVKTEIYEICERFEEDGDFIKVLAEVVSESGDISGACNLYKKALSCTSNGFTILEAKTFLEESKKKG